jgi:hypothetical protein
MDGGSQTLQAPATLKGAGAFFFLGGGARGQVEKQQLHFFWKTVG